MLHCEKIEMSCSNWYITLSCHTSMFQFRSVAQSCLTLCDCMDCSMPGFPVHHQLLELAQTHVHPVGDAIQPSHPLVPFSSCLQSFPASGSFLMSWLFTSGRESIGALSSASVLPVNIQGWFPFGLTGLISLQSKRLFQHYSFLIFKIPLTDFFFSAFFMPTVRCVCVCFQSPTEPVDYSLPVRGIVQARLLEQVAISYSQEIFQTQGWNLCLLHWQVDSLPLSHLGNWER